MFVANGYSHIKTWALAVDILKSTPSRNAMTGLYVRVTNLII